MNNYKFLKQFLILFIFLMLNPIILFSIDRADYDLAIEKYNEKINEEAIDLFQKFRSEFPQSVKADDALWYIGRLYKRIDKIDEAESAFREVLTIEGTNRFEEAAYDLGKILYYRKDYRETLELLSFINSIENLNAYHIKGFELSARALYRLAYREKLNYNEAEAKELFFSSLSKYKKLEILSADETDLSRFYFAMAEIYSHLRDITYNAQLYKEYFDKNLEYVKLALPLISDSDREKAEKMLIDLEESQKLDFNGRLTAYAGLNNLSSSKFGGDIYARASLVIPTLSRSSLTLDLSFKHDSFDLVTSNFESTKTGDNRLVQYTETLGADLSWRSGTYRNVYNKMKLFSDFQFAEDIRDNYIGIGLSDLLSVRFNQNWRFALDSTFEWRTYPNYLIAGRKLDYVEGSLEPSIKLYAFDWLDISLIYGIDLKQYLESKYHINVLADPSTQDKMNLYNSGEIVFDFTVGRIYNPLVSYKINYLKTFNYDYVVTESSGDDFVEGYYDYISHTFSFDNNFQFGDKLTVFLDSSLSLTNFVNYIARDTNDTYLPNNELRKDITVHLDLGATYNLWTSSKGIELDAKLSGWWDYKISNMTYNTTFDTNYNFMGVKLGMAIKMP